MVAAWIPGKTEDCIVEAKTDITLPGRHVQSARVFDVFNGTQQELVITTDGADSLLKGILIEDYPTFIQLTIRK